MSEIRRLYIFCFLGDGRARKILLKDLKLLVEREECFHNRGVHQMRSAKGNCFRSHQTKRLQTLFPGGVSLSSVLGPTNPNQWNFVQPILSKSKVKFHDIPKLYGMRKTAMECIQMLLRKTHLQWTT